MMIIVGLYYFAIFPGVLCVSRLSHAKLEKLFLEEKIYGLRKRTVKDDLFTGT